jgi:hypothetical protein
VFVLSYQQYSVGLETVWESKMNAFLAFYEYKLKIDDHIKINDNKITV